MSLPSSLKTPTSVFEPDKFRFAQSVFLDDSTFQHPPFFPTSRPHCSYFHFFNVSTRIVELSQFTHQPNFSIAASATFPISSHAIATTINSIDHTNQTCFSSPFGLLPTQPLDKAIDPDPGTFQASRQSTPLTTSPNSNMPPRTAANFHYAPPQLLIPALTWVPSSNTQTYIPLATDLRRRLRSLLQATAHRVVPIDHYATAPSTALSIPTEFHRRALPVRQSPRLNPAGPSSTTFATRLQRASSFTCQSGTRQDSTHLGRLRRRSPRASSALPASPAHRSVRHPGAPPPR